jgi:replicative DNA helicase
VHPHNLDAERALLGGLMLDAERLNDVTAIVRDEDFYREDHGALFGLFRALQSEGRSIDTVTVPERIMQGGNEHRYGGVAYVLGLPEHAPSTANLTHYAEIIREKAILRGLIRAGEDMSRRAHEQPEDVAALIDDATRQLLSLGQARDDRGWKAISEIIDQEMLRIEKLDDNKTGITGSSTGFFDLDEKLAGLQRTDLIVLAARPAMGKTALALNFALNAATSSDIGVGVFSMEMSRGQLVTRLLCTEAQVSAERMRTGGFEPGDWEKIMDASESLRGLRIHLDDSPGLSVGEVRSRARRLKSADPTLGLIVLDYIQLMRGDDARAPREQQISAISRGLKALAKDLDVTVIALSQLNRGVESRADKRPLVSDLRESGAIEQDADIILFIYRDDYYNKESPDKGLAEVIIAKQRNGPTGTVKLVFQGQFTRFANWTAEL